MRGKKWRSKGMDFVEMVVTDGAAAPKEGEWSYISLK